MLLCKGYNVFILICCNIFIFDRFSSLRPLVELDVDYVVTKIMEAILTNQEVLYIPKANYIQRIMNR